MRQKTCESTEQFITSLREQALKCKFEKLHDSLMKCMIITGINNLTVREKLLQDDDITLDNAIKLCGAIEKAKQQTNIINNGANEASSSDHVDQIHKYKKGQYNSNSNKHKGSNDKLKNDIIGKNTQKFKNKYI